MPRTRAHLDRHDKVDELVSAAERQLLEGGYSALSMAAIARELGLAQNALYWYFPSRDHLLVAALERIIQRVLERKPRGRDTVGRLLWFADQLEQFQSLRTAVHERAASSPVVAAFEASLHERMHWLAGMALTGEVPADRLDVTADALVALLDGVLLRGLPRRRRDEVIRFGYERLIAPHAATGTRARTSERA